MLLPLVFAALLAPVAAAQDPSSADEPPAADEPEVLLIPEWYVGDAYQVELVKSRRKTRAGETLLDGGTRTVVDVEVVGEDETGFVIEWTFGEVEFPEGLPEEAGAFAARIARLAEGMTVRFRTDEFGSYASLENRAEVRATLEQVVDELLAFIESAAPPEEQTAALREMLEGMTEGDAFLDAMAQDIAPFYMASGLALDVGEPFEYELELPNLLGGPAFPAEASWVVESHDAEEQTAVLRWTQGIDEERGQAAMDATLRRLAEQAGRPVPDDDELPEIAMDDEAVFVYDLVYGLPLEATSMRTVVTADGSQVDTRAYRLLTFPEDPLPADDAPADAPAPPDEDG